MWTALPCLPCSAVENITCLEHTAQALAKAKTQESCHLCIVNARGDEACRAVILTIIQQVSVHEGKCTAGDNASTIVLLEILMVYRPLMYSLNNLHTNSTGSNAAQVWRHDFTYTYCFASRIYFVVSTVMTNECGASVDDLTDSHSWVLRPTSCRVSHQVNLNVGPVSLREQLSMVSSIMTTEQVGFRFVSEQNA